MHDKKCCVPSCSRTREDNAILHLFPDPRKDLDRFNKWIYAVSGNLFILDPLQIYKYGRVCHSHFDQKFYTASKRLSANAILSLGLSGICITPTPVQQMANLSGRISVPDVLDPSVHPSLCNLTLSSSQEPAASTSKGICNTVRIPLQDVTNKTVATALSTLSVPSAHSSKLTPSTSTLKVKCNPSRMVDANYVILRKEITKLQKQKDSATIRLKKALKLAENSTFRKALGKFSPTATIFTNLQFREAGKHQMGCRFTKEEKVMALALYKQGPRAYRWLRKMFILPSPLTLSRMISRASLHPGINESLFVLLEKRVNRMKPLEKLCMLLFDEVALTAHFDYNEDFNFLTCNQHQKDIINRIEELSINLFIYNWCKDTNKLLRGSRTDFDQHDDIQKLSIAYCNKRQK